jgi:hypothetical protein
MLPVPKKSTRVFTDRSRLSLIDCHQFARRDVLSGSDPRMMLDVADALALLAEGACRRAEPSIAAILTVIFGGRDQRGRCEG